MAAILNSLEGAKVRNATTKVKMALGDFYVEEGEAPEAGNDDVAADAAAAADEVPAGTPRVSRAPKASYFFLSRQEARIATESGDPQKRQDHLLTQMQEVEEALTGQVVQKGQGVQVTSRQGRQTRQHATGLVSLVTTPPEGWSMPAQVKFGELLKGTWAMRAEPALASQVFPVPHGAPVHTVVAYVGASVNYLDRFEGVILDPNPKLVFLDAAYCNKLQRHNGEVWGAAVGVATEYGAEKLTRALQLFAAHAQKPLEASDPNYNLVANDVLMRYKGLANPFVPASLADGKVPRLQERFGGAAAVNNESLVYSQVLYVRGVAAHEY